jgi:hypothetical protein
MLERHDVARGLDAPRMNGGERLLPTPLPSLARLQIRAAQRGIDAETVNSMSIGDRPLPLRSSRSSWSRGAAAKGRKLHRVNVRVRQKQPTLPGYDEAFANCARSHRRPYAQCIGPKFAARQLS